jgi:syntaxin 5
MFIVLSHPYDENREMMIKDRTAEFFEMVQQQPQKQSSVSSSCLVVTSPPQLLSSTQSNDDARHVWQLSQTLKELRQNVTVSYSPFNHLHSKEDELVYGVKNKLASLKARLEVNTEFSSSKNEHETSKYNILREMLMENTRVFQGILRSLHQKRDEQEKRRQKWGGTSSTVWIPNPVTDKSEDGSQAEDRGREELQITIPMMQEVRVESYVVDQVRDIESQIVEIASLHRELAFHVAKQNEQIRRIEDNLVETDIHVTEAHRQLSTYFLRMEQNRWLLLKIFGVLLFFILLFVLFFI